MATSCPTSPTRTARASETTPARSPTRSCNSPTRAPPAASTRARWRRCGARSAITVRAWASTATTRRSPSCYSPTTTTARSVARPSPAASSTLSPRAVQALRAHDLQVRRGHPGLRPIRPLQWQDRAPQGQGPHHHAAGVRVHRASGLTRYSCSTARACTSNRSFIGQDPPTKLPAHGIDRSVVRPPQRHRDLTALFAKLGVPLPPKLHAVATAPPAAWLTQPLPSEPHASSYDYRRNVPRVGWAVFKVGPDEERGHACLLARPPVTE